MESGGKFMTGTASQNSDDSFSPLLVTERVKATPQAVSRQLRHWTKKVRQPFGAPAGGVRDNFNILEGPSNGFEMVHFFEESYNL